MSNPYFVASGQPATGAFAASAPMRTEFSSIEDAFDLLPALTANTAVVVNSAGTALTNTVGTLALAGNFATVGAFAVTLTATAATALTLPTTGTLATLAGAETFSNKTFGSNVALGTPVSGVATNLTGTAAGLTAGNVTTNANLTGPITSVGNTTSVAAQTGTGSTFVMQASPTLTTPNIGTPSAGILTSCTGLPLTTGITGILGTTNGGTGLDTHAASNGKLLIGNGSGLSLATLTAGTNVTITNGSGTITIAAPGSIDYSQIDTQTTSGTPSEIVFTGISSEDIIIVLNGVSITTGTASLKLAVSTNNGVSYGTARDISLATSMDTTVRYGGFFGTGFKIGFINLTFSGLTTTSFGVNASSSPTAVPVGFWVGTQIDAIKLILSASTFVDGSVITLYGRG